MPGMPPAALDQTGSHRLGLEHTGAHRLGLDQTGSQPPVAPVPPAPPVSAVPPAPPPMPMPAPVVPVSHARQPAGGFPADVAAAAQYSAVPYSAVPYSAVPASAVPYSAAPYDASAYAIAPRSVAPNAVAGMLAPASYGYTAPDSYVADAYTTGSIPRVEDRTPAVSYPDSWGSAPEKSSVRPEFRTGPRARFS